MLHPVPLLRAASLGALALPALAAPPRGPDGGIDERLAARTFREVAEMVATDGGRLWGSSLEGPLLLLDPASSTMVASRPDEDGRLEARGELFVGPLAPELGIANTAQSWAGVRWTTVLWPPPEEGYARRRLFAHELFHRLQPALGCPTGDAGNAHLDTEQGRVSLRLEWRALAEALLREGPERRAALGDALLFRAWRHALFPEQAPDEALLEAHEGLAEYTGWRLCGLPADAQRVGAAERLLRDERSDLFGRGFAYASGPAYALLLDAAVDAGVRGPWREGPLDDVAGLVREAYALPLEAPGDLDALEAAALAAAARHGGERVRAAERERAAGRAERLAAYRARFEDGPVLELPTGASLSYSFDPGQVESFGPRGQVFRTMRAVDSWGELVVSAGGVWLRRDEGGRVASLRVPAPGAEQEGPVVEGDGWRLELAPGWRLVPGAREGDRTLAR